MKILMACEDVPHPNLGGLGRHAITLANALARAGHEVVFLCNDLHPMERREGDNPLQVPFEAALPLRYRGWKERQLGFFNYAKRWYTARAYAQAILSRASAFDVVHYHGHAPGIGDFVPDTVNFVQSRHDQGADCLIHTRFRAGEVCQALEPTACATCVKADPNALQTRLSAASVRAFRKAVGKSLRKHKTIYVSRMLLDNRLRTIPMHPEERSFVIHNFVDKVALREGLGTASSVPPENGFLTVGRIDAAKGIVAFARIWQRHADGAMPFTLIGDGPDRPELEEIARGDAGFRYLGLQPYREVVARIVAQRFVVVPSAWEEPCATTILEAMALGQTVLALRRGGTPELVRYQLFEGQLRLFDDLEALAAAAAALSRYRSPLTPSEALDRFAWGVEDAIPRIMEVYRA